MKTLSKKIAFIFVLSLFASINGLAIDGSLDTTFGTGGKVTVDFDGNPTPGENDSDLGLDVAIQPDGKIVVSGETFVTLSDSALSVLRLNTDGTVDTTFATNGRLILNTALGINERAYAVAIQPDGKIIVAGRSNTPRTRIVLRLNPDGSLDNTFGTNGIFQKSTGATTLDEEELAIQTDGKIIVIGSTRNGGLANDAFSVMRLTTDGSLDSTFAGGGEAVTVFNANDRAYGVALQSDGKIVVSGSSNNNNAMAIARYNVDGTLDMTFDGDGKVLTTFPGATCLAQNLVIQPDGKIIAAGYSRTQQSDATLVRYNPNGSLDTSFSGDGIATFGVTTNELFWDVHLRNGKIIGTGFRALIDPSSIEDFMVVRFNSNGTLDTGFGTNGVVYTDYGTRKDNSLTSAVQPDGKLVLAGYSGPTTPANPDFAVARYDLSSIKLTGDFDGDARSDISVYRPINGGTSQWWIQQSSSSQLQVIEWGLQTDIPTPADFDGDSKTDIAIWRPAPATQASFYILNSLTNTVRQESFGQTGDNPSVVSDYDGDGKVDLAVYRAGSQGYFYYRASSNNPNRNTAYVPWGTSGDKPVAGDYNGDAKTDFAIFRGGTWWILHNRTFTFEVRNWGLVTDTIVPADYDGDGKTDLAVFRSSEGIWYVQNSLGGSSRIQNWGLSTDVPAPADYDGDGKADLGVYRNGVWYISQSSNATLRVDNLGIVSDIPIPSRMVIP